MSTNKHATIRYNALDRCFRNPGRRYYIDDLIEECNNAINNFDPESFGVQKRQVYADINFMISDAGFQAPIERVRDGKKVFLRYEEGSNFSISNQPLNESEFNQLQQAILTLNRFKGLPQFSWIEELSMRLESDFKLQSTMQVIEFEQNPYLKGLEHFDDIFNAIVYKKVVKVEYKGYKHDVTQIMELSPSYLKQYNNRWYLLAYNHEFKALSHLALDRVIDIKEVKIKYLESEIDFTVYFEDVIGVTIDKESEPIEILLEFSNEQWKYINSKPLHGSQKVIEQKENTIVISLEVQINFELERLVFSFGNSVKVLKPKDLAETIIYRAKDVVQSYL